MQAPDVQLVGSTYYMYYAISTFGTQNSAIGVATSPTMEVGSWTDLGATGIASSTGKDYNAIDPNLIKVGNNYLFVSLFLPSQSTFPINHPDGTSTNHLSSFLV